MWINSSTESGLSKAMNDALSEFLAQSVDEVVRDLLGARVREALYDCLMMQCDLSREQIPDHLENFQRFLNENLGKAGQTLANSIAKRFYSKLGWVFVSIPHHDLVDYVDLARKRTGKSTPPIASPFTDTVTSLQMTVTAGDNLVPTDTPRCPRISQPPRENERYRGLLTCSVCSK